MVDLYWLKRIFLGEPPRSARFDLQVLAPVSVEVKRTDVSVTTRSIAPALHESRTAPTVAKPAGPRPVHVKAREPVPADYLARQHLEDRERVRQVFMYRDRLQAVLDSDWANLSLEQMHVRALEGYRWLELLENVMAQDPERFEPKLEDARQILERYVQHAQSQQVNT